MAILAVPGVQLLDLSGPLDVFAEANVQARRPEYELCVVGLEDRPIVSSSRTRVLPDWTTARPAAAKVDTLLVAGAPNAADTILPDSARDWLRTTSAKARRYGSVCTGAFFLAASGLLDGRRVATHWSVAQRLALAYPDITVDADAIFVADGRVRTAAGVTAGLDLALSLVQEDLGRELAKRVAAQLVMFFKRPGGQLQFSRRGDLAPSGRSAFQELQRYISEEPGLDHHVASLAKRTGLSSRHFARLFRHDVGMTPAAYVETVRIDASRRQLETGKTSVKQVAASCGFADVGTLRRAFVRHVGVTPAHYRRAYLRR